MRSCYYHHKQIIIYGIRIFLSRVYYGLILKHNLKTTQYLLREYFYWREEFTEIIGTVTKTVTLRNTVIISGTIIPEILCE